MGRRNANITKMTITNTTYGLSCWASDISPGRGPIARAHPAHADAATRQAIMNPMWCRRKPITAMLFQLRCVGDPLSRSHHPSARQPMRQVYNVGYNVLNVKCATLACSLVGGSLFARAYFKNNALRSAWVMRAADEVKVPLSRASRAALRKAA